jgi:hypothetical protein
MRGVALVAVKANLRRGRRLSGRGSDRGRSHNGFGDKRTDEAAIA